jgi:hypothetical protein
MKLHANAALSLNKRRVLARRIVAEGWSLAEAAEAAEVSERTAGNDPGGRATAGLQGSRRSPSASSPSSITAASLQRTRTSR